MFALDGHKTKIEKLDPRRTTRLGVRLNLSSTSRLKGQSPVSSGHMNLENLVQYRWQLSLGETELSREEFDALVALKSPLVQIRGPVSYTHLTLPTSDLV